MKRLSLITAISAAFVLPGLAQAASSDSATLALDATVNSTCYIAAATFDALSFSAQVDGTTALLTPVALTPATDVPAYCNDGTTTLKMKSLNQGLKADVAVIAAGTFAGINTTSETSILPYTTSGGTWAGVAFNSQFDSNAQGADTDATLMTTTAINGNIVVPVLLDSYAGLPVLAGSYTDTITVTIATAP